MIRELGIRVYVSLRAHYKPGCVVNNYSDDGRTAAWKFRPYGQRPGDSDILFPSEAECFTVGE